MNNFDREKYEGFLIWLITPQNDREQKLFKKLNLVDAYIEILNSVKEKSDTELLDSIDIQLEQFDMTLNRTNL